MAEKEQHAFETVAGDDWPAGADPNNLASRKNIPIVMLLQGENVGKKYLLQKPENLIGRSNEADIPLSDFEVSRRHTLIIYENWERPTEPPRCIIRDLGSKNGTFVNGQKVENELVLRDKDIITIGSAVMGFYLKDEIEVRFDAELYSMATVDGLTGVHNRYYFQRELGREIQRAHRGRSPLALMLCDLDHFKRINDEYGHVAGDFVLRKMGEILMRQVREYDVCARYGGEEFAVILPNTVIGDATYVAERLRANVESCLFDFQEQTLRVTISIGVGILEPEMQTVEQLVRATDKLLYEAKESGRNRVVATGAAEEQ